MPEFVSLFSGLGGLDLGLETAGWDCAYATDIDHQAVESLKSNAGRPLGGRKRFMAKTLVEQGDIRFLQGSELLNKIGRSRGEIELMAGGPPCQSWSSAGHQLGFQDPRGRLIADYLRVAGEIDCRFLIFENVRGLVTARGADGIPGSALAWLRKRLFEAGWQTSVELLNAADLGVAQRRVRVVLIGYRSGDAPDLPKPTHAKNPIDAAKLPWRTLGECLSAIAPPTLDEIIRPTGKLADQLALLSPGTGVKSPGKAEATRPGGHWGYKQGAFIADLALPARTVTANAQQDWIKDVSLGIRRLSPRECAAIQAFPEGWAIAGSRTDQYRLIGNAVPPLLAQALGKALLTSNRKSITERNWDSVRDLPEKLASAIAYTKREEDRNGESRRIAPVKRRMKRVA